MSVKIGNMILGLDMLIISGRNTACGKDDYAYKMPIRQILVSKDGTSNCADRIKN